MCSYQRLNGTYACNSDKAQNGLLKGELGFKVRSPLHRLVTTTRT